jgi:FkbM family methyltransferase
MRRWWNLVNQAYAALGRNISFVDVGAATGDTVLLLEQRCAGKVGSYFCFEGDEEFENLLKLNMRQFDKVKIINAMLASTHKSIPVLVKHHGGSASATGDSLRNAKPLDSFASDFGLGVDVLKIDVDGYDGEVLKGAENILTTYQPWVIFEWHPALIERARTECGTAFRALQDCGYKRFLWFGNTGLFSHFSEAPSSSELEEMNRYLLHVNSRCDEHFDIVALPDSAPALEPELAAMDFAREVAHSMPA